MHGRFENDKNIYLFLCAIEKTGKPGKMISIITAVHNGLAMNKIFFEYLKKYTHHPFELIIIDNNSTDGSKEFFKKQQAIVIENSENYSYPYCQNQGIAKAKFDILAFLNNDIIVAPDWDKKLIDIAEKNNFDIITSCGIERMETAEATTRISRRWKAIKNFISLAGRNTGSVKLMFRLMYGNWEKFNAERFNKFGSATAEGFIGNTVLMKKSAIEKIGLWDERIQSADFDLYVRSKKRNLEKGDIKPVHIAWGVFNHHFIRMTVKSKPTAFIDQPKMISLEEKWGNDLAVYLKENVFT